MVGHDLRAFVDDHSIECATAGAQALLALSFKSDQ